MQEQADPLEFIRNLLWHLTWLRTEVQANRDLLAELLSKQTGQPAKFYQDLWAKEMKAHQRSMYLQALDEIKIAAGPEIPED